jgi:murein DD-endopeptidase MepM/ murein hydrolase activator NlpD
MSANRLKLGHRKRAQAAAWHPAAWLAVLCLALAAACAGGAEPPLLAEAGEAGGEAAVALAAELPPPTPLPTRPAYAPGELVEYLAQPGDTVPALAARFNSTVAEIMAANPVIPESVGTLPPGLPMQIPIYFKPFWGSPYRIIPDSLFVNGPAQVGFDTQEFIRSQDGWLNGYRSYAAGANLNGAETVDAVATNFGVSPRLLLALLEYHASALSQPTIDPALREYPLGHRDPEHRGLYLQLVLVANQLNDTYYRWRMGALKEFELADGTLVRPDPWQNAASVSLQVYYAGLYSPEVYAHAVSADGLASVYAALFSDPWDPQIQPHIQGSLEQPEMILPFEPGRTWALTGGPHTAWGEGEPRAALDFAPPAVAGGCQPSDEWVTAVAPGLIARSEPALVVLDLDGDGDERTGWNVFYFHLALEDAVPLGRIVARGDRLGHPSCEGGKATGTHVHIARKFNGEWILADGPLAFNLDGWISHAGAQAYQGTMTRYGHTVTACVCANLNSHIARPEEP